MKDELVYHSSVAFIIIFGKIPFFHVISAADYGSNHLLDANVLLISQEKCSEPAVYGRVLDNTMFCAGYLQGGVDSCQVSRGNSPFNLPLKYLHD